MLNRAFDRVVHYTIETVWRGEGEQKVSCVCRLSVCMSVCSAPLRLGVGGGVGVG